MTPSYEIEHNLFCNQILIQEGICMARDGVGNIYPRGKCHCGAKFTEIKMKAGKAWACPNCLSKGELSLPNRYEVNIPLGQGKPLRIYSDVDGAVLASIEAANNVLTEIRQQIKRGEFNPDNWKSKEYNLKVA